MTAKPDFLHFFYKQFLLVTLVVTPISFLVSGNKGLLGFLLGAFSMGLILFLWDLTLRFTLKSRKTNAVWESLLVFVRYGLLGGLFYAIIRWFVVSWPWFFAGVAVILPSLLISACRFKEDTLPEESEE